MSSFHRVHALTNTFSGVAGESRVAAELVRCGLRVAKPFWTDDEVDLLILERAQALPVPIAVQVKSVQFLPNKRQKMPEKVFIQGLKKRYVEKSPAFALAIYRVDTDDIFFIDGPEKVIEIYDAQGNWNAKHVAFPALPADSDVRLAVHIDNGLNRDCMVPRDNAGWLGKRVKDLAERVVATNKLTIALEALWSDPPAQLDSDEES